MNNRRSFFAQLAVAVAGTVIAPSILSRCAPDAFKWRKTTHGLYIINPAWRDAPLEIRFTFEPGTILSPSTVTPFVSPTGAYKFAGVKDGMLVVQESFPVRMDINRKIIAPIIEVFPLTYRGLGPIV